LSDGVSHGVDEPMIKPRSVGIFLATCMFAAQSALSECAPPGALSQPFPPFELYSPPGALRFFDDTAAAPNSAAREYSFSGSRLQMTPTALASGTPERLLRVRGVPVAWQTRLVSLGGGQVAVADLPRGTLDGSIIAGSGFSLGGLIRLPGSGHAWTAFVIEASPRQELAALEYLYALVLRADTGGVFSFRTFDRCAGSTGELSLSQSDLLHEIARRRNALAGRLDPKDGATQPWDLVSLRRAAAVRPQQTDEVSAVVEDAKGPVAGAPVTFSRAPHSGCRATSDAQGLATCTLQDNHGDDGDDESGPVVATFSGIFSQDRVAPPMATVIQK
jgi:hypothetical protein